MAPNGSIYNQNFLQCGGGERVKKVGQLNGNVNYYHSGLCGYLTAPSGYWRTLFEYNKSKTSLLHYTCKVNSLYSEKCLTQVDLETRDYLGTTEEVQRRKEKARKERKESVLAPGADASVEPKKQYGWWKQYPKMDDYNGSGQYYNNIRQ